MFFAFFARTLGPWRRDLLTAKLARKSRKEQLFGFEPGAFTDAWRRKEGLLERAHAGTLFLDEIGNMSPSVQAKLVRVLEEETFLRLEGTKPIKVNVRLVTATNTNLKEAVAQGRFREDLFYRLNVVPLFIPPLRERTEDVLPLALDMVRRFNEELKKNFLGFTPEAADLIVHYSWPGNIRELKNVVERTMILAPEGNIDAISLREEIRESRNAPQVEPPPNDSDPGGISSSACGNWKRTISAKCSRLWGTTRPRQPKFSASILRRYCAGLKKEPVLN
jgi:DNA-binding NtrC family response regulator